MRVCYGVVMSKQKDENNKKHATGIQRWQAHVPSLT
jgi:hypothetical protein